MTELSSAAGAGPDETTVVLDEPGEPRAAAG
jgi:hypothetical protein